MQIDFKKKCRNLIEWFEKKFKTHPTTSQIYGYSYCEGYEDAIRDIRQYYLSQFNHKPEEFSEVYVTLLENHMENHTGNMFTQNKARKEALSKRQQEILDNFHVSDVNGIVETEEQKMATEANIKLSGENVKLKRGIDSLKNCKNCEHEYDYEDSDYCVGCKNKSKWEMNK